MNLFPIINEIIIRHNFLGEIAQESFECYENEFYTSALFDLFISTEHFFKYFNESEDGNFHRTIQNLADNKKINFQEKEILSKFKQIRNKFFHEDLAKRGMEIDGILYLFSEPETRKILYEIYAEKIFRTISHLLMENDI